MIVRGSWLGTLLATCVVGGCGGGNEGEQPLAAPPATQAQVTPTPTPTAQPEPSPTVTPARAERADVSQRKDLARLVKQVARKAGGRVQLAVLLPGRSIPAAVASSGSTAAPFRMWSVSKVVTAIALLEAYGGASRLPRGLRKAMTSALVKSGDCAQRIMVVGLQEQLGGPGPTRLALQEVLDRTGARRATVLSRASVPGQGCRPMLSAAGLKAPYQSALQVGTAEWSVADGARLARAIGDGTFSPRVSRTILQLLRRPKEKSDDPFAQGLDVTSDVRWGAGLALAGRKPAYKAGWGGSSGETATFVNEQVIFLRTDAGPLGIAVTFEPPERPMRDDPGLTNAPAAFLDLLRGAARVLGF